MDSACKNEQLLSNKNSRLSITFSSMVSQNMNIQTTFVCRTIWALGTNIRLFSCVFADMCLQICSLIGTIRAVGARKGLLPSMDTHVVYKVGCNRSTVGTVGTMVNLARCGVDLPGHCSSSFSSPLTVTLQPHLLGTPILLTIIINNEMYNFTTILSLTMNMLVCVCVCLAVWMAAFADKINKYSTKNVQKKLQFLCFLWPLYIIIPFMIFVGK